MTHSPVLYAAESPEHAVAEALQPWRNRPLRPEHLERAGRPLALTRVSVAERPGTGLADLCDPATLLELGVRPDELASRHRRVTQPVAQVVWEAGRFGLRWWSVFWGDWHGVVFFTERLGSRLTFDEPEPLNVDAPSVRAAADALGMAG